MKLKPDWMFAKMDNVTYYFRRNSTASAWEHFFSSPVTHTTGGRVWAYLDNDCPGAPLMSIVEAHEWFMRHNVESPWEN